MLWDTLERMLRMGAVVLFLLMSAPAWGRSMVLPPSLGQAILTETFANILLKPTGRLKLDAYRIRWKGAEPLGVDIRLGEESLDWVRTAEVLLLPRATLVVQVKDAEGAAVHVGGRETVLAPQLDGFYAEVPVPLMTGSESAFELKLRRKGAEVIYRGDLGLPDSTEDEILVSDASCSMTGTELVREEKGGGSLHWSFMGCRRIYTEGDAHPVPHLEILLFLDGADTLPVEASGIRVQPVIPHLYRFVLTSQEKDFVPIRIGGASYRLRYSLPKRARQGSVSAGLGPYYYRFESAGVNVETVTVMPTLYGGFTLTETSRVVAFSMFGTHPHFFIDTGIYYWSEQTNFLDGRVFLNILLGAHFLAFRPAGDVQGAFSAPQGIEVVFRDFLLAGWNATLGAFLYPPINDRAYYNTWIRWGRSRFFFEVNYLGFWEPFNGEVARAQALGLTVGFPLFTFW